MCGILGVVATTPVNQLLYDGLLVLQHRGQDAAGIATAEGALPHAQGPGPGARRFPHPQHARPGRQLGHRPLPLSDGRVGLQRRRGATLLRQFAVRHRARPQRQSDQCRATEAARCSGRTCATSTPIPIPKCCSMCWRMNCRRPRPSTSSTPRPFSRRSPACIAAAGRLCRGGDDRRLRPARLPRSVRHPPAGRSARTRRRRAPNTWSPPRPWRSIRWASRCCATSSRARRCSSTRSGSFISRQCAEQPMLRAVHFRVRLSGASGFGDRRRLGLRNAAEDGRTPRRQDQRTPCRIWRSTW